MLTFLAGTVYTLGGAFTIGLIYYRATVLQYSVWDELGPLPVAAMLLWPLALPVMGAVILAKNAARRQLQREHDRLTAEAEVNETLLEAGL